MPILVCYGDKSGQGRGLARVAYCADGSLQQTGFLPLTEKPGGLLWVAGQLWVALLDEPTGTSQLAVYNWSRQEAAECVGRFPMPYHFSSFSVLGERVLAASFRDGADALLSSSPAGRILAQHRHVLSRKGSDPRQQACHSHFFAATPDARYLYATDLGSDQILLYAWPQRGLHPDLQASWFVPAGSGPRLMPFSPDGRFAYLLHELANRIEVLAWNSGRFRPVQSISVLDRSFTGTNSAAGCQLTADGRYLLVTNRGEHTLVLFSVAADSGRLRCMDRVPTQATPRDLLIQGDEVLVVAQDADCLQRFNLDRQAQTLQELGPRLAFSTPVGLLADQ